jgi:DNA-binding Lrp family transcriptional regulator
MAMRRPCRRPFGGRRKPCCVENRLLGFWKKSSDRHRSLKAACREPVAEQFSKQSPERFERFEEAVSQIPEVPECLLVTGQDADCQIKVVVSDMDAFQELLLKRVARTQGVAGVHSSFVLRREVGKSALPG